MSEEKEQRLSFEEAICRRNVPGTFERLQRKTVGVLGTGGLGTNVAVALTRAGVGRLILADPDRVELSNLNRQMFFRHQVGQLKINALAETLKHINPYISLVLHPERVTPSRLVPLFKTSDVLVEALDEAEEKSKLIEAWLVGCPGRFVVAGSGLAGYGRTEALFVRRMGHLIVCGDGKTPATEGLSASRVGLVAYMQANEVIDRLLA
jgi:sulfur carrier protein ThiS adenylyltransferase